MGGGGLIRRCKGLDKQPLFDFCFLRKFANVSYHLKSLSLAPGGRVRGSFCPLIAGIRCTNFDKTKVPSDFEHLECQLTWQWELGRYKKVNIVPLLSDRKGACMEVRYSSILSKRYILIRILFLQRKLQIKLRIATT